ncbi:myotubularin-related protein 2-like [Diaphorina citri]|uniref:Myotubularin-related protein 2-like n=1 Tax=Diaphorina citri TaxID=121845 RepID=A0A1S3DLU7_DIACI|nr:myotubularin-related protein 2-like [Diaphorina citri]
MERKSSIELLNSESGHHCNASSDSLGSDSKSSSLNSKLGQEPAQPSNNNEPIQTSRPDDLPLLPGEIIQGFAREVTYLCPYSGPARGILSVTNYKLYFRSIDRETPYVVEVPLGVVSRVEKSSHAKPLL